MSQVSTTGSNLKSYLGWVTEELNKKEYGEVSIKFVVRDGRIVDVRKESVDTEHFSSKEK
jgi:hypothetical protein